AVAAQLNQPSSVIVDATGNLYIVDTFGNRIRKVTKGVITTIAGTGERGYSGDGGQATAARLFEPRYLALDSSGNLYISDSSNHVIRKLRSDGTIVTIAGTGNSGFDGEGQLATQTRLNYPSGIAVDTAGNIYVADDGSFRVRKIGTDGKMTTIAGTGEAATQSSPGADTGVATNVALGYLDGLAVDGAGNVFVTEIYIGRVRRVDPTGKISVYAGSLTANAQGDGGPASKAGVSPHGLAVDASGNLFMADGNYCSVRKVTAATGIISTVVGSGSCDF